MDKRQRSREMETLAQEKGWRFSANGSVSALERFEFQTGEKRKIERVENLIETDKCKIFDVYWHAEFKVSDAFGPFSYKNMTAKNARQQTFILLESAELNLPKFHVYPTTSGNWIDKWLDKNIRQTDFSEFPEFAKRRTVLGNAKSVFNEKVIEFYKNSDDFWTFAVDNYIFFYQPDVLISTLQISDWVEQIFILDKLLRSK